MTRRERNVECGVRSEREPSAVSMESAKPRASVKRDDEPLGGSAGLKDGPAAGSPRAAATSMIAALLFGKFAERLRFVLDPLAAHVPQTLPAISKRPLIWKLKIRGRFELEGRRLKNFPVNFRPHWGHESGDRSADASSARISDNFRADEASALRFMRKTSFTHHASHITSIPRRILHPPFSILDHSPLVT